MALAVAEHLDFDVTRLCQIFLQIDRVVAESSLGLGSWRWRCASISSASVSRDLHAAPAAARRRLHQHGIADLARRCCSASASSLTAPSEPGTQGMPSRVAVRLASILSPMMPDMLGLGADEGDAVLVENFGETGVLGQKAVARMHGVGAGDLAGREQGGHVEIGIARRRRPDADAFVGELDVHRLLVGGRIDRDGRDAQLLRRA